MVQLQNLFFFITSRVVPRGTASPILLKWFVSSEIPTGAPSSNGTIIPIPTPSSPLLVYLHSRKIIRSMDGEKKGVLVGASCPILLPEIIGRSSSETRTRNASFCFVPVLHFLIESKGDLSCLESFCGVLRLLFFVLSSLYHAIGQRSVSGYGEGNTKQFGLKGMSNDEMTR